MNDVKNKYLGHVLSTDIAEKLGPHRTDYI